MKKILSVIVMAICILSVNIYSADPYKTNPNYAFFGAYGSGKIGARDEGLGARNFSLTPNP